MELSHNKKSLNTTSKCKIIMVIDGIDRFESEESHNSHKGYDSNKVEEESPDWFPLCFPDSFRVILTCKRNSKAFQHFKNMKIPFTFIHLSEVSDE